MLSDNPFFMREVRQLTRRPRVPLSSLVGCLCGMAGTVALWPFLPLTFAPGRLPTAPVVLWLLMALHTVLCCYIAFRGAFGMLLREESDATLHAIVVLPNPPLQWLLAKASFAILSLAVVWLAGIPFYMFAAVYDLIRVEYVLYFAQRSLLYGILTFLFVLIVPYDIHQRVRQSITEAKNFNSEVLLPILLIGLPMIALVGSISSDEGGLCALPQPFYTTFVPEWALWLGAFGATGSVAMLTCLSTVHRIGRYERLKRWTRVAALFVLGGGDLGLGWSGLAFWGRWTIVVSFAAMLFGIARLDVSSAPDQAARALQQLEAVRSREVAWLGARCDNPVYRRDIQGYVRSGSLRAWLLGTIALVIIVGALIAMTASPSGLAIGDLKSVVFGLSSLICIFATLAVWTRPRLMWMKERSSRSLILLLLTTLSSREILAGRLLATFVYHFIALLPLVIAAGAGIAWTSWYLQLFTIPSLIALSPLVVTFGIWICCGVDPRFLDRSGKTELATMWLGLAQVLAFAACGALAVLPQLMRRLVLSPFLIPVAFSLAFFLGFINICLAWSWFQLRVRELDVYRTAPLSRAEGATPSRHLMLFGTRPQRDVA